MISRARSARRKKWIWDIFWMSGHACFADPDTPRPPLFRPDGRISFISGTCTSSGLNNFSGEHFLGRTRLFRATERSGPTVSRAERAKKNLAIL